MQKRLAETLLSRKPDRQNQLVGWIIWMFLLFTSMIYWADVFNAKTWMASSPAQIFEASEYWRLWTATFIHADIAHFLSNSIMYSILGFFIYEYSGASAFPVLILVSGGLVQYLALKTYEPGVVLLGASGVVYVMGAFWLVLFMLVEKRYTFPMRLVRALGFSLVVLFPSTFEPNVSYRTHAIGYGVGLILGLTYYFLFQDWIRSFEIWVEVPEDLGEDEPGSGEEMNGSGPRNFLQDDKSV